MPPFKCDSLGVVEGVFCSLDTSRIHEKNTPFVSPGVFFVEHEGARVYGFALPPFLWQLTPGIATSVEMNFDPHENDWADPEPLVATPYAPARVGHALLHLGPRELTIHRAKLLSRLAKHAIAPVLQTCGDRLAWYAPRTYVSAVRTVVEEIAIEALLATRDEAMIISNAFWLDRASLRPEGRALAAVAIREVRPGLPFPLGREAEPYLEDAAKRWHSSR